MYKVVSLFKLFKCRIELFGYLLRIYTIGASKNNVWHKSNSYSYNWVERLKCFRNLKSTLCVEKSVTLPIEDYLRNNGL